MQPRTLRTNLSVGYEDNGASFKVVWKPLSFFRSQVAPLYPDGLLELLELNV
jgi:hypothetical protein